MKRHHTNYNDDVIRMSYAGETYCFPRKIAEKYQVTKKQVSPNEVFASINKKYSKPGALLRGIRIRENLTQLEMAKKLEVTQSDISQMEKGVRRIGRVIAQRIEKLFDVNYRSFRE